MVSRTNLWTVKRIVSWSKSGRINVDLEIQRNKDIWKPYQKSLLIHSLLTGTEVPPIYANAVNHVFEIIDGKQRLCAILDFIEGTYALSDSTPDANGSRIAGLNFADLQEDMKESLFNAQIEVRRFDNLSDEEKEDLFVRWNNGASFKPIENTRVILGIKNMRVVSDIVKHPFFDKTKLSGKRYVDQETILQILLLITNNDTGFSSKEIRQFVLGLRGADIPESLIQSITETLDYLDKGFEKRRSYMRKLHFPMIFHVAMKAMEQDIEPEYFAIWVEEFFSSLKDNSQYAEACQSGSAKKENVRRRLSVISRAFCEQFQPLISGESDHKEATKIGTAG